MSIWNRLNRADERLNKLGFQRNLPTLRCIVTQGEDSPPDDYFISTTDPQGNQIINKDPFALWINVETKNT